MEILKIKDLGFSYAGNKKRALDGVSLSLERGEFVAVQGATGSGKTTLLRLLKPELAPAGEKSGNIEWICGKPIKTGFVMQKPEMQIVTDKVWHELAFGLENEGLPTDVIRRRVAETAGYFGISSWFYKDVSRLSGGEKQLLNLASVMATEPELLLLDEPTAQLDPIAADEFIRALERLRRDLSLTVVMTEHRLDDIIPIADRLLVLKGGKSIAFGEPGRVIFEQRENGGLMAAMPAPARIFAAFPKGERAPLTPAEGRAFIEQNFSNRIRALPGEAARRPGETALELRGVFFRYEKNGPDVLRGTDLKVGSGEIFCLLGPNGSGKTTALSLIAGLLKPNAGDIRVFGKKIKDYKGQSLYRDNLALLPQDVQTVFLRNTVREELGQLAGELPFDVSHLLDSHPYDLSGGEAQIVAICKALSARLRLLMLDEPTKGLDPLYKEKLIAVLKKLRQNGVTVLAVTHDVEFAAMCADRCALLFQGEVVSEGEPEEFFPNNLFYTTAASRMSASRYDGAVTVDRLVRLLELNGGTV